jgi:hypothetical protein
MAWFSVSDLIIAATLLVNALALSSTRLGKMQRTSSAGSGISSSSSAVDSSPSKILSASVAENKGKVAGVKSIEVPQLDDVVGGEIDNDFTCRSPLWRLRELSLRVRQYSCVIVFWNMLFFFLMFSVFPS